MILRPVDVRDPQFPALLSIWINQRDQDMRNGQVHDAWAVTAADWKLKAERDRSLGLPIDAAPALPVMTIYHDDGSVEHPPFPDLKTPTLAPLAPPVQTGIVNANPPMDRTDALLVMVQELLDDVGRIKAKLGA